VFPKNGSKVGIFPETKSHERKNNQKTIKFTQNSLEISTRISMNTLRHASKKAASPNVRKSGHGQWSW